MTDLDSAETYSVFTSHDAPIYLGQVLLFASIASFFLLCISSVIPKSSANSARSMSVCLVEADANVSGRAYAQLSKGFNTCYQVNTFPGNNTSNPYPVAAVYQTNDYGQSWQHLDPPPPAWQLWHHTKTIPGVSTYGETLSFGNQVVWSFPRAQFRSFFIGFGSSIYLDPANGMTSARPTEMRRVFLSISSALASPSLISGSGSSVSMILR